MEAVDHRHVLEVRAGRFENLAQPLETAARLQFERGHVRPLILATIDDDARYVEGVADAARGRVAPFVMRLLRPCVGQNDFTAGRGQPQRPGRLGGHDGGRRE